LFYKDNYFYSAEIDNGFSDLTVRANRYGNKGFYLDSRMCKHWMGFWMGWVQSHPIPSP